ncbi:MAG: P63C domain-containing protein [Proteobacteria bacterium]|nr:P63C domain-containing protein [Pseudomonadota bacterium]MBU3931013.1 P63C domain-containing protein [Pseudomonadota bacterium]
MEKEQTGKAKGGLARAAKLTPEERTVIAKKAAGQRWEHERSGLPKVTHRGVLKIPALDMEIPCFVLDDERRVISGRGMTTAIGMKGRGQGIARIAGHRMLEISDNNNLPVAIQTPIKFRGGSPKINTPSDGFEATVLQELCEAILRARDKGLLKTEQEIRYGQYADILMRSFARVGIIALVDEATGYQVIRPRDALNAYLELIVRKELAAWAKTFPDEFYENIYKLKGWRWPGMQKNRFSIVAHYTRDLVYERIAPGLLQQLEARSPKNRNGHRKNKFFQWLTEDIGHPILAQHLHSLIMFQRLALSNGHGWNRFLRMVDKVLPKKGTTIELPFPEPGLDL